MVHRSPEGILSNSLVHVHSVIGFCRELLQHFCRMWISGCCTGFFVFELWCNSSFLSSRGRLFTSHCWVGLTDFILVNPPFTSIGFKRVISRGLVLVQEFWTISWIYVGVIKLKCLFEWSNRFFNSIKNTPKLNLSQKGKNWNEDRF